MLEAWPFRRSPVVSATKERRLISPLDCAGILFDVAVCCCYGRLQCLGGVSKKAVGEWEREGEGFGVDSKLERKMLRPLVAMKCEQRLNNASPRQCFPIFICAKARIGHLKSYHIDDTFFHRHNNDLK